MTAFSFPIVGFDLDGTLFDTGGDLAAAVNVTLAGEGRALLPTEAILKMVGAGSRHMLGEALAATGGCDDALLDRLYPKLLVAYEADIARLTKPYPGALDALDQLAARGVKIALVTNKLEHLAEAMLAGLGLRSRFATVIGGDTLGVAKPDPAPIREMIARLGGGRAAFVGDSRFDVEAAHNAGIPVVLVSFGYRLDAIEALHADAVIDHFADLIPALEALPA
ncbi:HAD-IA family hydrolase [Sphingomonas immobilis]|uniref:Phosphoglycolate phosphatase n=1 Tax=Sphingomonas immobilis TaxID=3063997 RepID=A0ABT8ZUW3_9SPHN|nr:HAD-IA family hydrolase [Sphingomonas sp. CA1-15]MDO7840992.1 HAD-IA family hydrolase [Sphingomonas sp. CA1-15]